MIKDISEEKYYTVWLDCKNKIASFRSVDGYDETAFINHDSFMSFLLSLQTNGYRFQ